MNSFNQRQKDIMREAMKKNYHILFYCAAFVKDANATVLLNHAVKSNKKIIILLREGNFIPDILADKLKGADCFTHHFPLSERVDVAMRHAMDLIEKKGF